MEDARHRLENALADRYTIERELGRGGNAVVYLARDRKHDRQVALKVLLPELAAAMRTERFLREIQISAKLTHPHILTLIDSGEADGLLYYVMPYVSGESLRDRLAREKRLSLDEALRITRDVADASGYAHRHDVLHRDIKPENILLADGHAMVADFGIARALSAAARGTGTETGLAVGTPAYMSPEQAAGQGETDARSDVYSLGCVLYEMLAGHPPFTGETPQEILARHALDPVPRLKAARPDIPDVVERAVRKALAKTGADRFSTPSEFVDALGAPAEAGQHAPRRRAPLYAGVAIFLFAGIAFAARTFLVGARPTERSVGVIPVVNLSGDPDNEYLSDGITEELINALVQIEGLRVPARTSSFYFKGKTLTARQIAESLHVATVLEASLRKTGDNLRITAQLINAADGYHLWSQTYNREFAGIADVLPVQEEIAQAIVSALKVKLAVPSARPKNVEAYELYLKGLFFWNRGTEEGLKRALEFFSGAIAKDSGFARAYAGLAEAYGRLSGLRYLPLAEAYTKERAAAERAVALDPQLAEGYASRGSVRLFSAWDWSGAEQDFRRAIELDPGYALGHLRYAQLLVRQGRSAEAAREASRAAELDPLSAELLQLSGSTLFYARQYGQALEHIRKAIELEPGSPQGHQRLAWVYLQQNKFADAIREFQTALDLLGGRGRTVHNMAQLGYTYTRAGRRPEALAILDELKARTAQDDSVGHAASWAVLYAGLGEKDHAFAWLIRACEEREQVVTLLRVYPFFDPLRSDPRFKLLLQKVGLER